MWGCSFAPFIGWGGGIGILAGLLLLALLVWLAVRAFTPKRSGSHSADRSDSMEILKTRLAKGEISLAEFDTLKKAL
ncbi:MAG: SHOCT domain-containing protein [Desulfovibrio sp.]|nr:SHOCT domain-containing protein [Desulfovibrio sp.]